MIQSSEIHNILHRGISLESIGVKNWALKKDDALEALTQIERVKIPILGGDVCELIDGQITYNYDNWHFRQLATETKSEFIKRSIYETRKYIINYKNNNNVLFAFVLGDELDE